jgi:hypothetical protein
MDNMDKRNHINKPNPMDKHSRLFSAGLMIIFLVVLGCSNDDLGEKLQTGNDVIVYQLLDEIIADKRINQTYIPTLEKIYRTTNFMPLKKKIIKTIGTTCENDHCNVLLSFLESNVPEIVEAGIIAIAESGSKHLAAGIRPLLKDNEYKACAIWCLGELNNSEDIPRLLPFLTGNKDIAFIAHKALLKMQ